MGYEKVEAPLLEMNQIVKSFQGVQVLKGVSLQLHAGEVLALMGENGAGKSTLMNVLMGQFLPDSGDIILNGKKVVMNNPSTALRNGIAMIYQELNPILDMSIAENIFLNREDRVGKTVFVKEKKVNERTEELLKRFGIDRKPTDLMRKLSVAECQMIEIIKAVSYHSRIIIMDEPTSSLSSDETEKLFTTIKELSSQGVAIIYITHRMEEIFALADRAIVLRDGEFVTDRLIAEATRENLIKDMVGRELRDMYPKVTCPIGEVVMEVKDFCKEGVFKNVSFRVHAGEILGISGLVGAKRTETVRAIFGLDSYTSGTIYLNGKELRIKNPHQAIENGIAMVSEDRKVYGLVLCRSIRENISLAHLKNFKKKFFIDKKRESLECTEIADRLKLKRMSMEQLVGKLSGGNQQKVVIAKWLTYQPKVLILDEPTRGIDVGAKAEIYSMMCELAAQGMAIIMISSELPEILGMSDRVVIMSNGTITGEVSREEATQECLLLYALGGKENEL